MIIRNPPGDFSFKYRFFVPFWNLNPLGHDGETDTKLTIFPVPGLENHKYITNTRLGAMEFSSHGHGNWEKDEVGDKILCHHASMNTLPLEWKLSWMGECLHIFGSPDIHVSSGWDTWASGECFFCLFGHL